MQKIKNEYIKYKSYIGFHILEPKTIILRRKAYDVGFSHPILNYVFPTTDLLKKK